MNLKRTASRGGMRAHPGASMVAASLNMGAVMEPRLALIVGAGSGLSASLARRFAQANGAKAIFALPGRRERQAVRLGRAPALAATGAIELAAAARAGQPAG